MKSLKDLGVLIDGVTEAIKHEIKKQEAGFLGAVLASLAASLVQPMISSIIKDVCRREVRRAGQQNMDKSF